MKEAIEKAIARTADQAAASNDSLKAQQFGQATASLAIAHSTLFCDEGKAPPRKKTKGASP